MAKASVFRILRTLEETGLVERISGSDRYRLGVRCLELGQAYLEQTDLRREALPVLAELLEQFNETVHLGVLDDELRVVYLDKLESTHAVGIMMSRVGRTAPSFCTGLGKAMLAALPDDPVAALEERGALRPYTSNTIATPAELRKELGSTRKRGYSLDLEEHEVGVRCVGVAIVGPLGERVAGLSISGPANRLPERLLRGPLAKAAQAAAAEIGRRLGGRRETVHAHPRG
jgi:IclR family acetate operon transcriptional repressor